MKPGQIAIGSVGGAVEAFVRGEPGTGTSAATGIVLAGTDRVALDAVGVAVLRLFGTTDEVSRGRVFEQAQIARAVELGLGVDELSMNPLSIPLIKRVIRSLDAKDAQEFVREALKKKTARGVFELSKDTFGDTLLKVTFS